MSVDQEKAVGELPKAMEASDTARPSTPAKTNQDTTASTNSPHLDTSQNRSSLDAPDSPATTDSLSSPRHGGDDDSPLPTTEKPALERTKSQASQFSTGRITIIMLSLSMALFLSALDVTIVTTALPVISQHFNASASDYTWVGSAYLLAAAASSPVWGKISDIFGRKNIILLANLIFLVGSLIAGISSSIRMLIGARVIQGIGGGGLIVLVYICIGDLFSMRERPKYYGFMGMTWAIASGVGPVVGGAFTQGATWRWCFYINLPLDGISLLLLFFFLKLDNPRTPLLDGLRSIDWLGVLTIVGGVVMFLFGVESGGITHPWDSAFTLCLIIFGLVTIVLFFLNEWKLAKYPIIPLRLFRNLSNLASLGVVSIHGFVFIGGSYYLPLYFQVVLGAGPILSGVYLFAMVVTFSLVSAVTGIFIKKTGLFREPIWFGLAFMTLGYGLFIDLPDHVVWSKIIIYQIITGIGVGPNFQSPLVALQSHLPVHDIAAGTATAAFIRNVSTSISVVLGGVIFQNQLSSPSNTRFLASILPPEVAESLASSSFGSAIGALDGLDEVQKRGLDRVFTRSLRSIWIFYTVVSAVGMVVGLGVRKKVLDNERREVKTGLGEMERVRREEAEERKRRKEGKRGGGGGVGKGLGDVEKGTVSGAGAGAGAGGVVDEVKREA